MVRVVAYQNKPVATFVYMNYLHVWTSRIHGDFFWYPSMSLDITFSSGIAQSWSIVRPMAQPMNTNYGQSVWLVGREVS